MPDFELGEIDPSLSRAVTRGVERSFQPGGFAERALSALDRRGLLPGGVNNKWVGTGTTVASATTRNMSRFDTIAPKYLRDLWRDTWMESRNQMAIINRNNEAAGVTMPEHIVRNKALRAAITHPNLGGANYENWIAGIKSVARTDPAKAAFLSNHLQLMMGDQPYSPMKFGYDAEGNIKFEPESRYETSDLFKHVMGDPELAEKLKGKWHPAKAPGSMAKAVRPFMRYSHFALAPAAALKHMAQVPGFVSNMTSFQNGLVTFGAMFGPGRTQAIDMMHANDAAADFFTDIVSDEWHYLNGWYSKVKWLNPKVGRWLARQGATPLLRGLRYRLMPMAAAQGNSILHESAEILSRDPHNRAAQVNLGYLNLRHQDVMQEFLANNHTFSKETIRTAINNSIEQRVFFNNPAYRSALALSPTGKAFTAYHWMGQNEKSWFQRNLMQAFHSRNPVQVASVIATMSILYPGVHWAMSKINEVLLGKKNPLDAAKEIIDPTEDAKMQSHLIQTYVEMTGWGVEWSKINAAYNHQLLEATVGAQGKSAANLIQDTAKATTVLGEGHIRASYPLWRDVLEDMPLHIGDYAAHEYFPTRAEEQERKPVTSRSLAAKYRRKPSE
jgi:hypothetical protein